jgi:hypothetical protein
MNVFFEIADCAVEGNGHKYLARYGAKSHVAVNGTDSWAMLHSDRVWAEDDAGVRYLKNRISHYINMPVDMKEFFLIKLRSHKL